MNLGKYSAQLSLEFMFYVGLVLIAISSYTIIFYFNYMDKSDFKQTLASQKISQFKSLVEYVYLQGEDFYLNYTFPENIAGSSYNLFFDGSYIILEYEGREYFEGVGVVSIEGTVIPGGKHLLYNKDGVIYVEPY